MEVLLFQVQDRRFGLPAANVQEVQRAVTIVPLPGAPSVVEGVIDVRGRVVPVFNIRSRFRLPEREVEPADHLILVHARGRLVALRVDRAVDLIEIDDREIEDPRSMVSGAAYVAGVARLEGGLVLVHDLDAFLSQAEAAALDAAIASSTR